MGYAGRMKPTLPRALQPWREWLDWFEPSLASVLGDLILQLDRLAGRSQSRAMAGRVEPDGIDDVRKRGSYERLLLSEWALADEMPEEFIRRAAHSEHLFLSPKLVAKRSASMIVAVFDSGPAQLGAPRLAQLALLILLARRAQAAHSRFAWGTADAPGTLQAPDTPALLLQFLRARCLSVAGAEQISQWQQALLAADLPPGERWLVGARPELGQGFDHIAAIRRGFDDRLHLVVGSQRARRSATLDLPKPREGVSILRGDFLAQALPVAQRELEGRFSLKQAPLFSASSGYVAVALAGRHRAAVIKIQDGEARKQIKPRFTDWPSGSELTAAVLSEKSFGGLIADETHLHFWRIGSFRVTERPPRETFAIVPGQRRWLPAVLFNSGGSTHHLLALDSAGHLVRWHSNRPGECRKVASDVFGIAATSGEKLVYGTFCDGELSLFIEHREAAAPVAFAPMQVAGKPVRLFALTETVRPHWRGYILVVFAPNASGETLCLLHAGGNARPQDHKTLRVGSKCEVVGLVRSCDDPGAQMLALSADRRRLQVMAAAGTETIFDAGGEIRTVSCSPDGERVALLTLAGQLIVLGAGGRRTLMSMSGSELATE